MGLMYWKAARCFHLQHAYWCHYTTVGDSEVSYPKEACSLGLHLVDGRLSAGCDKLGLMYWKTACCFHLQPAQRCHYTTVGDSEVRYLEDAWFQVLQPVERDFRAEIDLTRMCQQQPTKLRRCISIPLLCPSMSDEELAV